MQIIAGTIFGLLLIIGSVQLFASGQELKSESSPDSIENFSVKRSIVGTWQTSVTARNCQTGAPVAPAFPGLLTFNQGGTLSGTSTAVTSVYGVWQRENGLQQYSFAFISLRYNANGMFIGTQKVRQTATFGGIGASGNEFTTTGTSEVFDADGNLIATGCATSTGTRFD